MGLFGRRTAWPEAVLHPALGSQRAAAALPAAQRGDVGAVQQAYERVDPADRTLVLQVLCKALPPGCGERWVQDEPGNALAWAALGAQRSAAASAARGDATAESTAAGQMLSFAQGMRDARTALLRSLDLDASDPGAWYQLLVTDYAGGHDDVVDDLTALLELSPHDVEGLRTGLDLLGEKWHGEHGEARELAEQVVAHAPDGVEAHVVTAFVLRDEWFYTSVFEEEPRRALATLMRPSNTRALEEALDRSLRSPAHRPTESTALVRNHFAQVCNLADAHGPAREQFEALEGTVTRWPWALYGDPVKRYVKARKG